MLAALAVLPSATSAQPEDPLRRCIARHAEAQDFSGAVLVQSKGAETVFTRGEIDGPGSAPIAANTRFNLGSSSKMFTAVAVAQLVEAGKLGLDDSVGRYVAGLTPEASKVTIRQLLSHTSGLGNFFQPETREKVQKAQWFRELVPLVAQERPNFSPGSKYQYSNSGFLLLGMVVERVSREHYAHYLRAHIFGPAHMSGTSLYPGLFSQHAHGWTAWTEKGPQTPPAPLHPSWGTEDRGNPAGAIFSTLADMQRFFSALTRGRLVSRSMFRALITPNATIVPVQDGGDGMSMGLGFATGTFHGHRWIGHAGGLPGANAETDLFPDDGVTMIVLANRDPPAATKLYEAVRSAVFDAHILADCARHAEVRSSQQK